MDFSKDEVIAFGTLGYSTAKIASILGIDEDVVKKEMSSDFGKFYKRGRNVFEFNVHKAIMKKALSGDKNALIELKKIKKDNSTNE